MKKIILFTLLFLFQNSLPMNYLKNFLVPQTAGAGIIFIDNNKTVNKIKNGEEIVTIYGKTYLNNCDWNVTIESVYTKKSPTNITTVLLNKNNVKWISEVVIKKDKKAFQKLFLCNTLVSEKEVENLFSIKN